MTPPRKPDVIDVDPRQKCVDAQTGPFALYNATPGCDGRIIQPRGGGIKCNTCKGWFCF